MSTLWDAVRGMASAPRVYQPGRVPQTPQYPYIVLEVIVAEPDGVTLDASHGFRHVEVVAQSFGHSATTASDHLEDEFLSGVLDRRPVAAGWSDPGPVRMEVAPTSTDDARTDSGIYGLTAVLTFTATKEIP